MATRVRTVNFGTTKAGLSTVGFRLYSYANSVFTADGARSTAGVDEIIASTGIYGAAIDIADRYHGVLIWDTGEATPRYGVDSLDDIYLAGDSDTLRIIRNTIQNQANFEAEILNRLKTNSLDPNDPTLSTLRSAIERIDQHLVGPDRLLAMFGDAAAKVNVPLTGPDMTPILDALKRDLQRDLHALPKTAGIRREEFEHQMAQIVSGLKRWMTDTTKLLLDQRLAPLSKPRDVMSAADTTTRRMEETAKTLSHLITQTASDKARKVDLQILHQTAEQSLALFESFRSQFTEFSQTMASLQGLSDRLADLAELLITLSPSIQESSVRRSRTHAVLEAMT